MACCPSSDGNECIKTVDSPRYVWVDDRYEHSRNIRKQLESIEKNVVSFQNWEYFQRFIEENKTHHGLVLIMTIHFGYKFIPMLDSLPCILFVIIYYENENKPNNEISAAFENKRRVIMIHADRVIPIVRFRQRIEHESSESLPAELLINQPENSTEIVESKFVSSQTLLDCILRMTPKEKDKVELLEALERNYTYQNNTTETFKRFKADYTPDRAIQFYSSNDVFYENINKALRQQDVKMIILWRSYFLDLYHQLKKLDCPGTKIFYRGQKISKVELEKLKNHIGKLISVNSFFSTTMDEAVADMFSVCGLVSDSTVSVKFKIKADDLKLNSKPFANISYISQFRGESEVLFMAGSIFRIDSVNQNNLSGDLVWNIQMSLCDPEDHDLEAVIKYMQRQNGVGETNLETLSLLLLRMGQIELADYYLNRYLNEIPSDDMARKRIYDCLFSVHSQKGNQDEAVKFSKLAMELEKSMIPYTIIPVINQAARWKPRGEIIAGIHGIGNGMECLSSPEGIFINSDDMLCIADLGNDRILECDSDGNGMTVVFDKSHAIDRYQRLCRPTNIIHDRKSNILIIAENGRRRVIQVHYRMNPIKIDVIAENVACWGLVMDIQGALYVSDIENHLVLRFDREAKHDKGKIVAGGNGKGCGNHQLNVPRYIFVDSKLSVYVSDQENHRIMKWIKGAEEGIVVAGSRIGGDDSKKLLSPSGIVVDKNGVLYIADTGNHRVIRWRPNQNEGDSILGRTDREAGATELNEPTGIAFDSLGNIYISDKNEHHRILRFENF